MAGLSALRTLEMNGCNLSSLDGRVPAAQRLPPRRCAQLTRGGAPCSFPSLPALRKLHLSDNRIAGGLEALVAGAPSVELIDLSNNKVASAAALAPLAQLPKLSALDLAGCPLAEAGAEDAYRGAVLAALPRLEWLDSKNRQGVEGEEDGSDDEEEDEEGESDEEEEGDEEEEDDDDDDEEAGLGTAFLLHGNADEAEAGDGEFEGGEEEEDDEDDLDDEEEEEAEAAAAPKRQRTDA